MICISAQHFKPDSTKGIYVTYFLHPRTRRGSSCAYYYFLGNEIIINAPRDSIYVSISSMRSRTKYAHMEHSLTKETIKLYIKAANWLSVKAASLLNDDICRLM